MLKYLKILIAFSPKSPKQFYFYPTVVVYIMLNSNTEGLNWYKLQMQEKSDMMMRTMMMIYPAGT